MHGYSGFLRGGESTLQPATGPHKSLVRDPEHLTFQICPVPRPGPSPALSFLTLSSLLSSVSLTALLFFLSLCFPSLPSPYLPEAKVN
jgi:hypothetical protein